MSYSAIVREALTRLRLHSATSGLLDGLKVKQAGEFRVEGVDDLPSIMIGDLDYKEGGCTAVTPGKLTFFLRVRRDYGWFRETAATPKGLLDWEAAVMDALERNPDGTPGNRFQLHKADGTPITKYSQPVALFKEEVITWESRTGEITDASFMRELTMSWTLPAGRKSDRSTSPIPIADYA